MSNIPDISLALHACRQEGREPKVVPWSWWCAHRQDGVDYLVLQDDTYWAWADAPEPDHGCATCDRPIPAGLKLCDQCASEGLLR